MTPVPLELPLRPADVAAVANLIFDQAERKPLTDELRARLVGRSSVLRLGELAPYFGSLERDPVHPSTYYLAVDGIGGQPLLLHMALANAPTGSLFPKMLLIGRMPRRNGPEMVINCLPFGPMDGEAVERFASQTGAYFLPKPLGPRPAIVVESDRPAVDFPVALETFRGLMKRGGRNLAALAGGAEAYRCGVWAAIRAGWRDGYGMGTTIAFDGGLEEAREVVRKSAGCSRFTVALRVGDGADLEAQFGPGLRAAEAVAGSIRQTRSALKVARSFDFELGLEGSPRPTSADDLTFCLGWLKERGLTAQLVAPELGGVETAAATLEVLAPVARREGCTLSVASCAGHSDAMLAALGRATLGRLSYRLRTGQLPGGAEDLASAIGLAAMHLFG